MQDLLRQTYVLSLRGDQRATIPADWKERVRALPGVSAGASASPMRMQIEVTPESLTQLREELGHLLLIEPVALRGLLDAWRVPFLGSAGARSFWPLGRTWKVHWIVFGAQWLLVPEPLR